MTVDRHMPTPAPTVAWKPYWLVGCPPELSDDDTDKPQPIVIKELPTRSE
jgi:hypothetical protein